jgi:alpha-beta hydrolase superfamily lysophospholipase
MSAFKIEFEWVHITYQSNARFTETYGFSGSQGVTNVEGILIRPAQKPSRTLLVFMHPASTLHLLPLPRAMAAAGHHVLCAGSRYQRNDTALIMENVLLDLGEYVRTAKEKWGYEKVVLFGWSGGGSLAMLYQAQAERPTIDQTPAGDPIDLKAAALPPVDAILSVAAHASRAQLLAEWIDPSVLDENDPDKRDPALDLYTLGYEQKAEPHDREWLQTYRTAQLARMRRISERVLDQLDALRTRNGAERERGFVTHRTMADPRFLDLTIDPNGRKRLWTYMGHPEAVNSGPVGLARYSTLRSWLSQWSIDHSRANSLVTASDISAPALVIECGADDAVPAPHARLIFERLSSSDKEYCCIQTANHYFAGQPNELREAVEFIDSWLSNRSLG